MRKLTVLSLAGLLILAFSAVGYAQAPKLEFRASGFIDAQTFWGENVPQYNGAAGIYGVTNGNYATSGVGINVKAPGWNKVQSNWESRAHLKFDAVMGPNLSGTIYFEIDTFRWGALHSNYPGNGREANNFGSWSTDRAAVEVKNIYIDVGLPYFGVPWPVTVRVGAQPLGIRPAVLMTTDGTGITAGIKIDPVLIAPFYAKALEGLDFADDDVDVWGLHANAKLGTFTVGAYGLAFRMNTYPFYVTNPNTTVQSNFINALQAPALIPSVPGTFKSHMYWLGAYTDGKAGPVNLNFDFVYDYGSVDDRVARGIGEGRPGGGAFQSRIPNVKYEGWMVRGKLDFPWEKFNFGMVGMYATGADARRSNPSGLPGSTTAPGPGFQYGIDPSNPASIFGTAFQWKNITRRVTSYVVPPGSEQGPANGESMVVYSMEPGATGGYGIAENANYSQLSRGGFGGTWFAKLYASVKLLPWYKLTVQGLYIGDTTLNGDTFGNSVKYIQAIPTRFASDPLTRVPVGTTFLRDNTDIGWEFDLMNEIMIYNNLRFFVGAGYLFAGDALDVKMVHNNGIPGAPGSNITGSASVPGNRKADNPWAIRTRLQYVF
jgi:hypothetical protein